MYTSNWYTCDEKLSSITIKIKRGRGRKRNRKMELKKYKNI
jgi:hypothetical protein